MDQERTDDLSRWLFRWRQLQPDMTWHDGYPVYRDIRLTLNPPWMGAATLRMWGTLWPWTHRQSLISRHWSVRGFPPASCMRSQTSSQGEHPKYHFVIGFDWLRTCLYSLRSNLLLVFVKWLLALERKCEKRTNLMSSASSLR